MNISPGSVTKQKERSKDEKYSDLDFFLALMNGMTTIIILQNFILEISDNFFLPRCSTTYRRVCSGDDRRERKEAKRQRKGSYRGKRSPVGILQAVLLANALSARHPVSI